MRAQYQSLSTKKSRHPFARPFSRRCVATMTEAERRGPLKPAKVHVRRSYPLLGGQRVTVCGIWLDVEGRENPRIASALSEVTCQSCHTITENDEGRMVSSADYVALQNADRDETRPKPAVGKQLCYCDQCGISGPVRIFKDGLCPDCRADKEFDGLDR